MIINDPSATPRELILVVEPKAGLRVREGKVISIEEGVDVVPLRNLLSAAQAVIRPLYGVSEEWLKHRTSSTKTLMGVEQRLDLSIFYKITCPDDKLNSLAAQLRKLSIVQSASGSDSHVLRRSCVEPCAERATVIRCLGANYSPFL